MTYIHRTRSTRSQSTLGLALGLSVLALAACETAEGTPGHSMGDEVATTFYSLDEGEKQGPGTVTVTDARPGSVAELAAAGFDVDVDPQETTTLYVDVSFTNTGEGPVDLREPSGVDADGNLVPSLTVVELGDAPAFDLCPALPHTLEPGGSVGGCSIILVPDGVAVERISYLADVSEDFEYWTVP